MSAKPIEEMTSAELDAEFARLLRRLPVDQLEEVAQRLHDLAAEYRKPEGKAA
ncbi:hypothetical protein [Pelagibacterium lacus]|uniref:hypothetical protein n=1 Tax=Pelagibacterium lacus TaxID=2282655 RepID=UPI001314175B|nr:hypothetical protein [Pelagibacterium lacus]